MGRVSQHLMRQPLSVPSKFWPFQRREKILTIIDLGAHKVACAILSCSENHCDADTQPRDATVLGHAVVRSAGISGGRIVNMAAAETCVRRAVAKAEAQAGVTAEDVIVTSPFSALGAEIFEASFAKNATCPARRLPAIASAADGHLAVRHRKLLHVFTAPLPDRYDGVDIAAISVPQRDLRQISACLRASLLNPSDYIAGPIASAYAVTTPQERGAGVVVVDMGASSVGCVLFSGGLPVFVEVIAGGARHITQDIAQTFALKPFEAERLKIRHASVYDGLQADIDLPFRHGETGEPISRFALNRLVRSHVSSRIKAVNERLKSCGYSITGLVLVLTGGGSLLPGLSDLASQLLAAEVRIGKSGAAEGAYALSGLIGACHYVCLHQLQSEIDLAPPMALQAGSYATRISHWLKTSF